MATFLVGCQLSRDDPRRRQFVQDIKLTSDPRPKVLLTSVCRPFGGPGEGDSVGAELFHAQVTRAQGIFSLRQVIRCWAIVRGMSRRMLNLG